MPIFEFYSCLGALSIELGVWTFAAYCRNSLDGQWYSYDDSTVEPLREDEVNSRGAYILFYQKRNSIPPWSASSSMRGVCHSSEGHGVWRSHEELKCSGPVRSLGCKDACHQGLATLV